MRKRKATGHDLLVVGTALLASLLCSCNDSGARRNGNPETSPPPAASQGDSGERNTGERRIGERIDPGSIDLRPATAAELMAHIQTTNARAILLNVWATWCIPCREEFPDLLAVARELEDRGLVLMLVSADFEDKTTDTRQFLAEQGVDFPSFLKTGRDQEFIDTLDERWSGALPATWVFDGDGVPRHFWENKASHELIRNRVLDVLNSTP